MSAAISIRFAFITVIAVAALYAGCGGSAKPAVPAVSPAGTRPAPSTSSAAATPAGDVLVVTSTAFQEGGAIPAQYTCDGASRSPALAWSGAPAATAAFALVVDDPNAPGGTFTHWLVFNMPAGTTALAEGAMPPGISGQNDAGRTEYTGPCPPPGNAHHYRFTIYALSAELPLQGAVTAVTRASFDRVLPGHVLAQGHLTGIYQRR